MSGQERVGRYPVEVRECALRVWVRRAETDTAERPGFTNDERARMRLLEKEHRELRRANEMEVRVGATDHRRVLDPLVHIEAARPELGTLWLCLPFDDLLHCREENAEPPNGR